MMEEGRKEVGEALATIRREELEVVGEGRGEGGRRKGERRAAIFYLDTGSSGLTQLRCPDLIRFIRYNTDNTILRQTS